jgi:hypothetical protein
MNKGVADLITAKNDGSYPGNNHPAGYLDQTNPFLGATSFLNGRATPSTSPLLFPIFFISPFALNRSGPEAYNGFMEEEPITSFTVGEQFPGPVPHREGAIMELWEIGLTVVIEYPKLRKAELKAFNRGFKTYSYLESPTPIPIAVWVFDFPNPHGAIDCSFNARVVSTDLMERYLEIDENGIKNGLNIFLLDGNIIRGIRMVSLNPEAVKLFHKTLRKQLEMAYDRIDFNACLGGLFTRTTRELYDMGRKFRYGK